MLQFLHKPPLELYECFGDGLKRAYGEYYLFEVVITEVIGGIIGEKLRSQFEPSLHLYLLAIRHDYVNNLWGFLGYLRMRIGMAIDWCERESLVKIGSLEEDASVIYAYEMGV
jgi:hypothetical protein